MTIRFAAVALAGMMLAPSAIAAPVSGYAGQESREIKALSPEEVDAYLSGKGMGFAKAAELNGYPGPAHVLELAAELQLSADQRRRTEALFAAMQSQAIDAGRALVGEERSLDRSFARKEITPALLAASLDRIAALQARIRAAHLDAHVAQLAILLPEQVARYEALRGYASAPAHDPRRHAH